jgi:hypothetical protein
MIPSCKEKWAFREAGVSPSEGFINVMNSSSSKVSEHYNCLLFMGKTNVNIELACLLRALCPGTLKDSFSSWLLIRILIPCKVTMQIAVSSPSDWSASVDIAHSALLSHPKP